MCFYLGKYVNVSGCLNFYSFVFFKQTRYVTWINVAQIYK